MPNLSIVVLLIDAIIILNKVKESKYSISTKKVMLLAVTITMGSISATVTVLNN